MLTLETDPIWWAIIVSYCVLVGFTVGIGLRDGTWDTISSMVARAQLTLHGFAMATFAIVLCQVYWIAMQLQRWHTANKNSSSPSVRPFWLHRPVALTMIAVGGIASCVGTLGFGVVSQNVSEEHHLRFAAVSFCGVLLYLSGFLLVGEGVDAAQVPHSWRGGMLFIVASAASLAMLAQDGPYWWEYILVSCLHCGALSLTLPRTHVLFAINTI